jgi:cell division protein ZapA
LTITPDQEQGLRSAAQKIDSTIKQFEKSYSVQDKQDVLAMCALQFAAQNEQKTIDNSSLNEDLESRLIAIDKLLDSHLINNVL